MKDLTSKTLGANEILELVFTYMAEISSLRDYDSIIMTLANMGRALTSAQRCSVWVVNEDRTKIWTKVAHGIDGIELPIDSGIVGDAIVHGKRVIIDDVYKDKRFNPEIDKKTGYRTKSMMVIPMYDYEDTIIGAFQVINRIGEDGVFDKRDLERLTLASTYGAETIIAAKLEDEVKSTQKEVVYTMGSIAESRSKETGNHVKRVAEYSKILALGYGMDEEEAELLKEASPMHDIGKIAIPDAILKKPGRFDENEREIMNTHAELGYHMIKSSKRPLLKAAAIVAYEHHEKWDGSGYPRGLKGEQIHIYGRITAVADVFDALGSDRVYKKAWEDERIFKLFKEESSKHFDPKLVEVFFQNKEKLLAIRDKFQDRFVQTQQSKTQLPPQPHLEILGVYGGKTLGHGTTCIKVDNANMIDAGNLLEPLGVNSIDIEHIWLTHSHLDHIVDIAYIIETYYTMREKTLYIHGLDETIETIQKDFLNNRIWPDFSQLKLKNGKKVLEYVPIEYNHTYRLKIDATLTPYKTDHTVKSCGYIYKEKKSGVIITADTYSMDESIMILNEDKEIKALIVECSFPNEMESLAKKSKHLTPKLLFNALEKLKRDDVCIYINHIKPSYEKKIKDEIAQNRGILEVKVLKEKEFVNF
jgi:HD-GYP domain-containing protein (c-di-GMP phosphodiesterase class II)/ribonuclease BN (tRNA processing enzyme)